MNYTFNYKKAIVYVMVISAFWLMCINYCTNYFNIVDSEWFNDWQVDSEWLVKQRLVDDDIKGLRYNYGLLGEYPSKPAPYKYSNVHGVYTGQIGLQGLFLGVIYRLSHSVQVCYWIETILLVICVFFILYWLAKEINLGTAIATYFIMFFNNWIIVSARNLYWSIWIIILPTVIMLLFLHIEEKSRKNMAVIIAMLEFICIFLKSGCGYEFVSLAMINVELPIFYYSYKNNWSASKTIKRIALFGVSALSGFLLAISINITQVYFYYNKSFNMAINSIVSRVAYRTGLGEWGQYGNRITDSLNASKFSVLEKYFNEGIPIFFDFHMDILLMFILIGIAFALISKKYSPSIGQARNNIIALDRMSFVSFFGPISWFLLASGHSFIHTHICYLLWSLPFLLFASASFFSTILLLIKDNFIIQKRRSIIVFSIILISIFSLYINNFSYITKQVNTAKQLGMNIYTSDMVNVYLYKSKIYYICSPENNNRYIFFLHFYTTDSEAKQFSYAGFVNKDFKFKNFEVALPFWEKDHVAIVNLPDNYFVDSIETGQWDHLTNKRFWEIKKEIYDYQDNIVSFTVSNLNDDNWENGSNRTKNILSVESDDASMEYLSNKNIEVDGNIKAAIIDVQRVGGYYYIYTNKHIDIQKGKLMIKVQRNVEKK